MLLPLFANAAAIICKCYCHLPWTHWASMDWGIGIGLVISVAVYLLYQFFIVPVFYCTSFLLYQFFYCCKNQKKTACGLYYKYEVSIKSLYYILPVVEKRSYLSWKNCWDILPFVEKSKMSLIFRKQKCPFSRQICPVGYW